jgi:lipopolysaccharide/colanic/teichoic acid biosynthesis glycosyltransferase
LASLKYFSENEILAEAKDPEGYYIKEIMPAKLTLNLEYIEKKSFLFDLKIIFKTISKIINRD